VGGAPHLKKTIIFFATEKILDFYFETENE
jgi:hypothetical protein